ncbi:MAG: hypothetical protein MUC31_07945 [Bacteroidales bacterium]|jgi:hypothetical protein|nr:hypothetical protein [Bacteroidales bacterium]
MKSILKIQTPTTKAVGSKLVTRFQPTALVVGDAKNETAQTFSSENEQACEVES